MHYFRYDFKTRLQREDPFKLLKHFGLKSGMKVLDLGCNDGFYALSTLKIIGSNGFYHGVDIDQIAINNLKNKLQQSPYSNYCLNVSLAEDFLLKDYKFDFILLATVLHDFKKPKKVLKNLNLMSHAITLLIDYDFRTDGVIDFGPPKEIRFSLEFASAIIQQAGFKKIKTSIYNQNYYIIKARV